MTTACVYVHKDSDGKILYVGMSSNFSDRHNSHRLYTSWFKEIRSVEIFHCETKEEAAKVEGHLIAELRPIYNRDTLKKRRCNIKLLKNEVISNFMRGFC